MNFIKECFGPREPDVDLWPAGSDQSCHALIAPAPC
jgi:hypothetical protein